MQRVFLVFEDGERRELCHDGTGGLFDGGFVVGLAAQEDDLAKGGTGELYTWGDFREAGRTPCRSQCDDCPAG